MTAALVLDLTRLLPGPLAGRILASLGFRVVRVPSPRGDLAESAAPQLFEWLAQDKEALALDLKTDEGRGRLFSLAREAQILLESSLPGVMERMQVGPEALRKVNPRLVYVRIAGYPPPHHTLPGHDLTYLAGSGVLGRLDCAWQHVQLADLCGAFWAAIAALDGVRKGGGYYEVHLADAFSSVAYPAPSGLDGSVICYGLYDCSDGKIALAALEPAMWSQFCKAVARPDLVGEAFSPATMQNPACRQMCELFRAHTAAEWETWAEKNRLPLRAVRERPSAAPMPPWTSD